MLIEKEYEDVSYKNFKQIEIKEGDCYLLHYKSQTLSITPENMEVFIEQGFTYESNLASLPDKFQFI